MLRFASIFSLLLFVSAIAAPIPKVKVKDSEAILGKWKLVEKQKNGMPSGVIESHVAILDGKTITIARGRDMSDEVMSYKLDTDKKWIDLIPPQPDSGETMKGRYELDGDTLIIAVGMDKPSERPKEAKGGPGIASIKLQRIKEEKK